MFNIKFPQLIKNLKNLGDKKVQEKKRASSQQNGNSSFVNLDEASSSYGVASVKINSVNTQKKKITRENVEQILRSYLKNDGYKISQYRELFSNLDKLDYENIDIHLKNIKTLFGMCSNSPNNIIKKGYFYSKEGAEAFATLEKLLSAKSEPGYVAPLSIALEAYDPNSVLILKERGLLTSENVDNSRRLLKLAKMSDEEYSSYQRRVDESIKQSGFSFEELCSQVMSRTKNLIKGNSAVFLQKKCLNPESVVSQLKILDELQTFPIEINDFNLGTILKNIDIDNFQIFKNILDELKERSDIDEKLVSRVFSFSNLKNGAQVVDLLSKKEIPLSKIIEYCSEDKSFKSGDVPQDVMLERIYNDPVLKTIRALENSQVNFVPTNTMPTELNPRNIDSSSLVLVHMTEYLPENGKILSTRDKIGGSRNSVHFTLNHPVSTHRFGCWEEHKYAIIMPYESTVNINESGKFIEGMPNDIYTNGSVKIPKGSVIVKYNTDLEEGSIKIFDSLDLEGVKYIETSIPPHSVVPSVIKKMGYTHMQADGPLGLFSYGKQKGKDPDEAILNYSAWKEFCNAHSILPTKHTGSAGEVAETVIENIGRLCFNNTWYDDKTKHNYKKELLLYLEVVNEWKNKGYFVSYDTDVMKQIVNEAVTPKEAVEMMKEKLGFHPTIEYDYFFDSMFHIPVDLYEECHKVFDNLGQMKEYIQKYEL